MMLLHFPRCQYQGLDSVSADRLLATGLTWSCVTPYLASPGQSPGYLANMAGVATNLLSEHGVCVAPFFVCVEVQFQAERGP